MKKLFVILAMFFVFAMFGSSAIAADTFKVDIKVNNQDGPVMLSNKDTLTVTVSLDPNGRTDNVDLWVCADTPYGVYFYTPKDGWTDASLPAYQGKIFNLPSYNVIENMPLSELKLGKYTLYFGIDAVMDGKITGYSLNYDKVVVDIYQAPQIHSILTSRHSFVEQKVCIVGKYVSIDQLELPKDWESHIKKRKIWAIKDETGQIYIISMDPGTDIDPVKDMVKVFGTVYKHHCDYYIEPKKVVILKNGYQPFMWNPQEIKIESILDRPDEFLDKEFLLTGTWGRVIPPVVTRSDTSIMDATGAVAIAGSPWLSCLYIYRDASFPIELLGVVQKYPRGVYILPEILTKKGIKVIWGKPENFLGLKVLLRGVYMGWHGEEHGPPVTRSDWAIKDGSGSIYVTASDPNLDPVKDIYYPIEILGTVKINPEGIPYIEKAEKIRKGIGVIRGFYGCDMIGAKVLVRGKYVRIDQSLPLPHEVESSKPWIIKDDTGEIFVDGMDPGPDIDPVKDVVEVIGTVKAIDVIKPEKVTVLKKDAQRSGAVSSALSKKINFPDVNGPKDLKEWTFMVYIDGDNNLEDAAINDFLEMHKLVVVQKSI